MMNHITDMGIVPTPTNQSTQGNSFARINCHIPTIQLFEILEDEGLMVMVIEKLETTLTELDESSQ
jgi:hypothetical protein